MRTQKPKKTSTKVYPPSKTIPGQSLKPADLLKRHLAGTLPDIDQSQKYEYHYDENGEQIGEPLPLEMYEVHKLAVALRERQFEAATEARRQKAIREREQIIEEYKASIRGQVPTPEQPATFTPELPAAGDSKTTG